MNPPQWAVGIDVGGTKIAAAAVSDEGTIRRVATVPTPVSGGAPAILAAIVDSARAAREAVPAEAHFAGVGLSTGGVIDCDSGTVLSATTLLPGWVGMRLADELVARLHVPVAVDNDGNAHALGEHRFGAGDDATGALYVAVGTGIGAGIVLDGAVRRGRRWGAGELGHLYVGGKRPCSCGAVGHLEGEAAGPAMVADYRRHSGRHEVDDLRTVVIHAAAGDPSARDALQKGAAVLGAALGGLANTLDLDAVVVGGGVAAIGRAYWQPLQAAFTSAALPGTAKRPLRAATLGGDAPLVGAAALLFDAARAAADAHPPSPIT